MNFSSIKDNYISEINDNPTNKPVGIRLFFLDENNKRTKEVEEGKTVTIKWKGRKDDTTCEGFGFSTNGQTSGTVTSNVLHEDTTYKVTCSHSIQNGSASKNGQMENQTDIASKTKTIHVINDPTAPKVNLKLDSDTINQREKVEISWNAQNVESCEGDGFETGGKLSGTVLSDELFEDTTFSISCVKSTDQIGGGDDQESKTYDMLGNTVKDSKTVRVRNEDNEETSSVDLTTTPDIVNPGVKVRISWNAQNVDSCEGDGFETGGKLSGSVLSDELFEDTTFSISCVKSTGQIGGGDNQDSKTYDMLGNTVKDSKTVRVRNEDNEETSSVDLTATPGTINSGNMVRISWNAQNVDSCESYGFETGGKLSGSVMSNKLYKNTTFSISCTKATDQIGGDSGEDVKKTITFNAYSDYETVIVNTVDPEPNVTLSTTPGTVNSGAKVNIYWDAQNVDSCEGNGFNTNGRTSGSITSSALYENTTFSISCTKDIDQAGGDDDTDSKALNAGGTTVTDSKTVIVMNENNTLSVTLQVRPEVVNSGNSTLIYWNAENVDSCTGYGFNTNGATSGYANSVKLYNDTTFSITCEEESGSPIDNGDDDPVSSKNMTANDGSVSASKTVHVVNDNPNGQSDS